MRRSGSRTRDSVRGESCSSHCPWPARYASGYRGRPVSGTSHIKVGTRTRVASATRPMAAMGAAVRTPVRSRLGQRRNHQDGDRRRGCESLGGSSGYQNQRLPATRSCRAGRLHQAFLARCQRPEARSSRPVSADAGGAWVPVGLAVVNTGGALWRNLMRRRRVDRTFVRSRTDIGSPIRIRSPSSHWVALRRNFVSRLKEPWTRSVGQ